MFASRLNEDVCLTLSARRYRDFGQGFYVTKFRRHAEAWAMNGMTL
jgi:hypothetical protein